MTAPRVVIAAGGTAGHVVPALAVADALRDQEASVVFVGGDRVEAKLVPAAGYELHTLRVAPLHRRQPLRAARSLALDIQAAPSAVRILRSLSPAAVLGGGYVAGVVGLAAALLGIPLVLTEADSHLGLANRALAPFAKRVCLAFPLDGRTGQRYWITGRPVLPPATGRGATRARLGIRADERCVLVFGGSTGARSINLAAVEAFAGASFHVLHAPASGISRPSSHPAHTTTCAASSRTSAMLFWLPISWWPAPAGLSSRSPPTPSRQS